MVFLRDRLANYEWSVADYYMRRGAWISAIHRADTIINNYQQTPRTKDALQILTTAYNKLGLIELADSAQKVLEANYPGASPDYKPYGPS